MLEEIVGGKPIKKTKTLEQMEKRLLDTIREQVYKWNCEERLYRHLYDEIKYWNWLPDLNDFLVFECGYKILPYNKK